MLSITRTKEILKNEKLALTDKEAERIRDGFNVLTEVIFEKWRAKREQEKSKTNGYRTENKN